MVGITRMVAAEEALPGRDTPIAISGIHVVLGTRFVPPYDAGLSIATFAMGCFWGAERKFWELPGVHSTGVGYTGGFTPHPSYEETCTGYTGHAESVLVLYRPEDVSFATLLGVFWENHDPTQGMRQGNDVGTEYRSAVFFHDLEQHAAITESLDRYQERLAAAGFGAITTEIAPAGPFYFAEEYHQQYLAKNPWGYCGLGGTGVACPVGIAQD